MLTSIEEAMMPKNRNCEIGAAVKPEASIAVDCEELYAGCYERTLIASVLQTCQAC